MAKGKKSKVSTAIASCTGKATGQQLTTPTSAKAVADSQPSHATLSGTTMTAVKQTVLAPAKGPCTSNDNTKVSSSKFQAFISNLEASPPFNPLNYVSAGHGSNTSGRQEAKLLSGKGAKTRAIDTTFAGLFRTNRKLTKDNKLSKFTIEDETIMLESNDLTDVRAKLRFCLICYIVDKFPSLQAIHALSKSWGASFQQNDSGWLVFRFARDDDRQRILDEDPYFIYGRPLVPEAMPDCFEFKEDDINLTPVLAILPSLPLKCWHPHTLGKIASRLDTPIAMDSLIMKMERVSYPRILIEVDTSKTLVDQVEFKLPNRVIRRLPIVYKYTPKFCIECNHFGHHKSSCHDNHQQAPATAAVGNPAAITKQAATKNTLPTE
ncbi:hypothetical protein Sango_1061300 [Sesamum angolense]|uniref:DUF4283 domain-containing protein n=1 Tax=Sesamum angolense TaxID=2727404 RepID=A0AAE2BZ92_9LAMI|nr:hypothetical protein Sango_1061300 [Sesamum angolense]